MKCVVCRFLSLCYVISTPQTYESKDYKTSCATYLQMCFRLVMFAIVQITTTTMEHNTKSSLDEQVDFFLHEAYGLFLGDLHPKCKYEWVLHSGYRFSLDGCPISMPCEGIRELVRSLYQCHRLYSLKDNAPEGFFDNSTYKHLNTGKYETVCLVATVGEGISLNIIANGNLFDILIGDEALQYGCTSADVWGILYRGNVKSRSLR